MQSATTLNVNESINESKFSFNNEFLPLDDSMKKEQNELLSQDEESEDFEKASEIKET